MANYRKSINHLKRVDPVLAEIIEKVGPCRLRVVSEGTHFQALTRSIVFQQLSGKAAATILSRVTALFPGNIPTAVGVTRITDEQFRSAGLSRQKIGYLRDLAAKVASGALPLEAVDSMTNDDLIAHLVQVKGIGRWTAQMFLMFRLGRLDVLPELDLGIQNAIQRAYRKRKRPSPKEVARIGAKWAPHGSVASWYLWRSLENGDGQLGVK
jgi:3-methyladenine DNA glycosylase/8-oxoguanine DNA glycosylase